MQQALDAAAVRQRREAAHGVHVLVEDARRHLHAAGQRLDLVLGQRRLHPGGGAQHLAVRQALAEVFEGGPALQVEEVFRPQHLGRPPGGLDERLVEFGQERVRPLLAQRLEALAEQFLGLDLEQRVEDADAQLDAVEPRALAERLQEVRQPPALLPAARVAAQGVAGPAEGPVGVHLAQDVVLVGADEVDGEVRGDHLVAVGPALPVLRRGRRARGRRGSRAAAAACPTRRPPWPSPAPRARRRPSARGCAATTAPARATAGPRRSRG